KLEVRFRDSRQIHDFVFRAVAEALSQTRPGAAEPQQGYARPAPAPHYESGRDPWQLVAQLEEPTPRPYVPHLPAPAAQPEGDAQRPLGTPLAQIRGTYILSQTEEGVVLV